MRGLLALALVAVPLMAASGHALAQGGGVPAALSLTLPHPDAPIEAHNRTTFLVGEARYTAGGPLLAPVMVGLRVGSAPAWATVSLVPDRLEMSSPPDGTTSSATASFDIHVSVRPDATGYGEGLLEIVATAEPDGIHQDAQAQGSIEIEPGFVSELDVRPPAAPIRVPVQGSITISIDVTHRGSREARVGIQPVAGDGFVASSDHLFLPPGESGGLRITLRTNDDAKERTLLPIDIVSVFAFDPQITGDAVPLRLAVERTDRAMVGFRADNDASAPSPAALPLLGALLGALAAGLYARRRLRKKKF